LDDIYLAGVSIRELRDKYDIRLVDLMSYLPPTEEEIRGLNIEVHHLGFI